MELPVCETDLKRDSLCAVCEAKINAGLMSQLDIKISRELLALEKQFSFQGARFNRAIEVGETTLLLCEGSIGALIGKDGMVVKELSRRLSRKVKIVGQGSEEKKALQELLGRNVRIVGVNKVFRQSGTETKVLLAKQDARKLFAPKEKIEEALKLILKTKATMELV